VWPWCPKNRESSLYGALSRSRMLLRQKSYERLRNPARRLPRPARAGARREVRVVAGRCGSSTDCRLRSPAAGLPSLPHALRCLQLLQPTKALERAAAWARHRLIPFWRSGSSMYGRVKSVASQQLLEMRRRDGLRDRLQKKPATKTFLIRYWMLGLQPFAASLRADLSCKHALLRSRAQLQPRSMSTARCPALVWRGLTRGS
jgi:hypothetical protein